MTYRHHRQFLAALLAATLVLSASGCGKKSADTSSPSTETEALTEEAVTETEASEAVTQETETAETQATETEASQVTEVSETVESETVVSEAAEPQPDPASDEVTSEPVYWSDSWTYAGNSKVHQESVTLYHAPSSIANGIVIAVNAGHGSVAAQSVKTYCHPDGTAKCTGGSTAAGSTTATGANSGTTLLDGTTEASVNLELALIVKEQLLAAGYDVLMLREASDCDLDNIARTVYANNAADCHIALHYDSTENDKGLYYTGVPEDSSYRSMEPVASHWQQHEALGQALIAGAKEAGVKVWSSGTMAVDLTQTSYSTVPSVDLEVGDRGSDHSSSTLNHIAEGIVDGLNIYFGQ